MGTADNVALLSDMRSDSVPNIDAIPPIPDLDLEDEVINRSLSEPDLSKDDVSLIRRRNGNYYVTTLMSSQVFPHYASIARKCAYKSHKIQECTGYYIALQINHSLHCYIYASRSQYVKIRQSFLKIC